jgi:glucose-1-phosphate adenylyltransferase
MSEKSCAVVLAGGKGMRLGLLSAGRPKPLLPFGGTHRVMDFALSNCLNSGIRDVLVATDYGREAVSSYAGRWSAHHAAGRNYRVIDPARGHAAGTADVVFQMLKTIVSLRVPQVVVMASDHICRLDYREALEAHRQSALPATVLVTRVPEAGVKEYGVVETGKDGRAEQFIEKPARGSGNTVSMGIYIFNTEFLEAILRQDAADALSAHDFGHSIMPGLCWRGLLNTWRFSGYWRDIGTIESYYQANLDLLAGMAGTALDDDGWRISTGCDEAPAAVRWEDGQSLVSPGCRINGRVISSILGPGVTVGSQAEVRNSIILAGARIGPLSVIDTAVVDEGASVHQMSCVGFGLRPDTAPSAAITVIGKGSVVPPLTAIAHGSRIGADELCAPPIGSLDAAWRLASRMAGVPAGGY